MTSTKEKLIEKAKATGITLEFAQNEVEAIAPDGMTFRVATGCHYLVSARWDSREKISVVYMDMLQRIECGVQKCECQECQA
jgi:hypothetical protein